MSYYCLFEDSGAVYEFPRTTTLSSIYFSEERCCATNFLVANIVFRAQGLLYQEVMPVNLCAHALEATPATGKS